MSDLELFGRIAAYLLSCGCLWLGSFALAARFLRGPLRCGLRLLATIAGQLGLTAILVQTLGLAGQLSAAAYFGASLLVGAGALYSLRGREPLRAAGRLLARCFQVWVAAPAFGLGWLTLVLALYLAGRHLAPPQDIDAMSLHGPLIVEWVQQGRVSLASHWNYPQCWEYQFVPIFLLLRSDLLSIVPALLGIAGLALAVRELAARLRFGGYGGHLVAGLVGSVAVVWRDPFKNDAILAFALLLGLLAIERAARGKSGSFWLLQLGLFLMLGTKPSGFLYGGAFLAVYFPLLAWRRRWDEAAPAILPLPVLGRYLALTLLIQVSAAAVQLRNFWATGNPIHPVRFKLAGIEIFPGPVDLAGTSILENAGQLATWRHWLGGSRLAVGPEWPIVLLLLLIAAALSAGALSAAALARSRHRLRPGSELFATLLPLVALGLLALYFAMPWSSGFGFGSWDYLVGGHSLCYALAPIALGCLVSAALLRRGLGARGLRLLLAAAVPLLVAWKWRQSGLWAASGALSWLLAAIFALGVLFGRRARRRALLPARRRPAMVAAVAAGLLAAAFLFARHLQNTREGFWLPEHRAVWTAVWRELPPGSQIAINLPRPLFRYQLYGKNFDNRLVHVDLGKGRRGRIPAEVSRIYVVPPPGGAPLEQILAAMETRGWRVVARPAAGGAALLAPSP